MTFDPIAIALRHSATLDLVLATWARAAADDDLADAMIARAAETLVQAGPSAPSEMRAVGGGID